MKDKLARNEQKKMTVHEALVKIWDNRHEKSLNYAVNYATYGMELPDGEELKVQCLYVLNNMSRWRGPVAKEVRETLKAYSQRKGVK
jgi:CRISPR/Cas system-associated protein Cas10 (large subunit of type III CRISPR-Cas system)